MDQQPLVSVIIPVFNEGLNLSLCLDSLLNNQEKRVEIIVVDDGSTDNSLQIAEQYAASNPSIHVYTQANQGVCAARNLGLSKVHGQFVTFVDGDAYVESLLLDNYLQLQAVGDYDLVACGVREKEEGDTSMADKMQELDQEAMLYCLFDDPYFNYNGYVWNKLYRTQIIQRCNILFEDKYGYNADRMFNFQYMRHMNRAIVNGKAYYHCAQEKGSIVERDLSHRHYGALEGFERMLYYSRKYSKRLQRAVIRHYCNHALRVFKSNPDMEDTVHLILSKHQADLTGWLYIRCKLFLLQPYLGYLF